MRFEILENGEVVNTIMASREFVEQNYPGRYREAEGLPPTAPKSWPAYEFYRRFTIAEIAAILSLANSDPLAAAFVHKLNSAVAANGSIVADDDALVAGISYLQAHPDNAPCLTAERAATIISYTIKESEWEFSVGRSNTASKTSRIPSWHRRCRHPCKARFQIKNNPRKLAGAILTRINQAALRPVRRQNDSRLNTTIGFNNKQPDCMARLLRKKTERGLIRTAMQSQAAQTKHPVSSIQKTLAISTLADSETQRQAHMSRVQRKPRQPVLVLGRAGHRSVSARQRCRQIRRRLAFSRKLVRRAMLCRRPPLRVIQHN